MKLFTDESLLLAIESSCDETSAAVLHGRELRSNVISSQMVHARYGGVIPELASRAHVQVISHIVRQALQEASCTMRDVEGIAVTAHPGLAGALVVGTSFAKGLALKYALPLVAVNHIEGHIFSGFLENAALEFPFIALVVSGGHTSIFHVRSFEDYEMIGSTRDDAAGEAFDKVAKLLGLGYPGGAKIDALAKGGNPAAIAFPRAMMNEPRYQQSYDFSFSGLKTAVRVYVQNTFAGREVPEAALPDLCASAQEAIAEVLVAKTMRAVAATKTGRVVIAGGVAANSRLQAMMREQAVERDVQDVQVVVPSMQLCTDNAAMIGLVGREKLLRGVAHGLTFTVTTAALRAKRK
jgi:N6-L-threonylcarbamoyladenine synthase